MVIFGEIGIHFHFISQKASCCNISDSKHSSQCYVFSVIQIKDTDLDTAAQATRASSVNNLTSYF